MCSPAWAPSMVVSGHDSQSWFERLAHSHPRLSPIMGEVELGFRLLRDCIRGGRKVLTCGNGGSAADSEHIVAELLKGFRLRRSLDPEQVALFRKKFPETGEFIASHLQGSIPAISLVSMVSIASAVANDCHAHFGFAQQVYGLGTAGDTLICISTSGNSANVLYAAQVASVKGLKVLALTGGSGGRLVELADVAIRVPADDVADIQELHLPIYHTLCSALEEELFGSSHGLTPPAGLPDPLELVVFDFDGVMTDNKVLTTQDGTELVTCDRRDGLGIHRLHEAGVPMLILSMEANPVVAARAKKLQLPVETACVNKAEFLRNHLRQRGLSERNVIYIGNDLNDYECMKMVGFSVAPADAHPEVKNIASLVLNHSGGNGAVRELSDLILAS